MTPCPCGSGKILDACCAPFVAGKIPAPTAEALMRSRYTAFCLGKDAYLLRTNARDTQSTSAQAEILQSIAGIRWRNLVVIGTQKGTKNDSEGYVEFAAAFSKKPSSVMATPLQETADIRQMHERSFFVRQEGLWIYVDGEQLPPYRPKPNALCWCGSAKKTKHCHR